MKTKKMYLLLEAEVSEHNDKTLNISFTDTSMPFDIEIENGVFKIPLQNNISPASEAWQG